MEAPSQINTSVRWVMLNKRAVILCLDTNKYFGLNSAATLIWKGLSDGLCEAEICQSIAHQQMVGLPSAMADYEELLNDLRHSGLIGTPNSKSRHHVFLHLFFLATRLAPLTLRAWACQVFVSLRLKTNHGLMSIYDLAKSATISSPNSRKQKLSRCLSCFIAAENISIRPATLQDCLPRSLGLFLFLKCCGFHVRHIIGISDTPLRAHAWVEFDDEILLDTRSRVQNYAPISYLD